MFLKRRPLHEKSFCTSLENWMTSKQHQLLINEVICACDPRWARTAPTGSSWSAACLTLPKGPRWRSRPAAASGWSGTKASWGTWRPRGSLSTLRTLTRWGRRCARGGARKLANATVAAYVCVLCVPRQEAFCSGWCGWSLLAERWGDGQEKGCRWRADRSRCSSRGFQFSTYTHVPPPLSHTHTHTHRPTDIRTETHGSLLFSGRFVLEPLVVSGDTVTPGGFSTLTFSAIRLQHNVTPQRQSMMRPTGCLSPVLLFIFSGWMNRQLLSRWTRCRTTWTAQRWNCLFWPQAKSDKTKKVLEFNFLMCGTFRASGRGKMPQWAETDPWLKRS